MERFNGKFVLIVLYNGTGGKMKNKIVTKSVFGKLFEQFYLDNLPTEKWEAIDRPFRRELTGNFTFRIQTFRGWCWSQTPVPVFTSKELANMFKLCGIVSFKRRFKNTGSPLVLWEAPI